MKTYYTPRSKYYLDELAMRTAYPQSTIEHHAANWQASTVRDQNVLDRRLLGHVGGYGKPRNTKRVWIVARSVSQLIAA